MNSRKADHLRAHRYKPGQSGNPAGRPPTKGLAARLKAELGQEANGGVLAEELLAKKLVRLALRGNLAAIRECFDRTEGKPRMALDLNDVTRELQGRTDGELLHYAETGKWPGEENSNV
jgi:hypothetical protein